MKEKRRSGPTIMMRLIGLVKPLWPVMALAIILGVVGYLCAIFLTILAGCCIAAGLGMSGDLAGMAGTAAALNTGTILITLAVVAVMRGILHYGEQYCNHFIAFKLLAIIRHKVFAALRRLAPAKLEGRDRGNLIAVITSDIELLEVFYAHTISPIAIGTIVSIIMTVFIWQQSALAGIIAAAAYITVGLIIPVIMGRNSGGDGLEYRNAFGELNSYVLESLRGLDESIQYGSGEARLDSITGMSTGLAEKQRPLNRLEQSQRSVTNLAVIGFSMIMLLEMTGICKSGDVTFAQTLICTIAMLGSFGPVIALSNLTSNLQQTFASGNRVLDILDEEPETAEVPEGKSPEFDGAALENVTFAYDSEVILDDYILEISKGKITGIHGASGSGKSTMLKLLMRFWDPDKGTVRISGEDIRTIRTDHLRDMEGYVTQETYIFHDSIGNNIAVGRPGAAREEIIEAAKKASVHDFIMSLPDGYDTMAGELGDTLSGGERQRIGIARAFLHDAPFLLLDEPTSNLDSLNEGIILKSLKEEAAGRTVILVSHRKSTLGICEHVHEMKESGRVS